MRRKKKTPSMSKSVTVRCGLGSETEAGLAVWGREIENKLEARLGGHLEDGETLPGIALFFELMRRCLAFIREAMVIADGDHRAQCESVSFMLGVRNRAAETLHHRLIRLRSFLEGVYGRDGARAFGFAGRTPRPQESEALVTQARETLDVLRLPEQTRPPSDPPGFRPDFSAVIPELEGEIDTLRRCLRETAGARHDRDATQLTKNEALAGFDEVYTCVVDLAADMARLAGEHELADCIKPRRRTRRWSIAVPTRKEGAMK